MTSETKSQFEIMDRIWATSSTDIPPVPGDGDSIPVKTAYYDAVSEDRRKQERRDELGIGEVGDEFRNLESAVLIKGAALCIRNALSLLKRAPRVEGVETIEYALCGCERDLVEMQRTFTGGKSK